MAERIQYSWYRYVTDTGAEYSVKLRKRNAYVGDFEPWTLEQFSAHPSGIRIFAGQNLDMRHVTVRIKGTFRYLQFPCATPDCEAYNSIGAEIQIPLWDDHVDIDVELGETLTGIITGRTGERFAGVNALLDLEPGEPA